MLEQVGIRRLAAGEAPSSRELLPEEMMIYKQGLKTRKVIEQQEKRTHTLDKIKAEKPMHECELVRVPG